MFPVIETIDDVLPAIAGNIGFFVNRFDDYDVIDYGFVGDDTFRSPMALECRGLKFAKDGRLLARPFHKFFNLGERQRSEEIDWSQPHVILSKLDGSMIHPCLVKGELVFMTRMGVTAQAKIALTAASDPILSLSRDAIASGLTPIFEFTSPANRIVIAYDRPDLTLLAVRENRSGRYLRHAELQALAGMHGVALVPAILPGAPTSAFAILAREEEGIEGFVIVFEDGHRLKLKTSYYALRHKALSGLALEKNILAWVAENAVDDVIPLLSDDLARKVGLYRQAVIHGLNKNFADIEAFVAERTGLDRRRFAEAVLAKLDRRLQPAAFAMLDGKDARKVLIKQLLWASQSETRLDSLRDLYNMSWSPETVVVELG